MQSAFLPAGRACAACSPSLVDPDDLAGPDLTHGVGADEVERAGFRCDDPVLTDLPEHERPEAERVAERDERRRPRARSPSTRLPAAASPGDRLLERRRIARDQRRDELRVRARGEPNAVLDQLGAQLLDVHEVAVVAERDRACAAVVDRAAARSPTGSRRSSSNACARSRPRPAAPAAAARRRRGRRGPSRAAR